MQRFARVLLILYVAWLVACAYFFATDPPTGGPYDGIVKSFAAVGAGLPWTLAAFYVYPPNSGPKLIYAAAVVAALVNLLLLARWAGWWPWRRP